MNGMRNFDTRPLFHVNSLKGANKAEEMSKIIIIIAKRFTKTHIIPPTTGDGKENYEVR